MTTAVAEARESVASTRWVQLVLGMIAMMSISSPQYVWTLFTKPFQDALGVNLPAIQVTFTILIVLQTCLLAGAGISGRSLRPAPSDRDRLPVVGAGLDHIGLCRAA